ncbi:DMT family transporter [bacterium]|nr:DMT family transporter [bacterium]
MTWIFLAIIANFFWSLVNIGDKYLVSKKIQNPYVYLVVLTWAGVIGLFLIPFIDFFVPEFKWLALIVIASASYFFGSIFYFHAVKIEDISRINIWWNLIPIFTLVISWVAIDEKLTNNQLSAFVILIIGAIIASIHFGKTKLSFSKALPLMFISTFVYAIYFVIIRYVSSEIPFLVIYVWNLVIVTILTFPLFLFSKFRKDFKKDFRFMSGRTKGKVISIAVMDESAILINMWALSLGPVALISVLGGLQSVYVFILVVLISLFRPHIIKEKLDKRNAILKLVALCVIIVGVLMLNLR